MASGQPLKFCVIEIFINLNLKNKHFKLIAIFQSDYSITIVPHGDEWTIYNNFDETKETVPFTVKRQIVAHIDALLFIKIQ